MWDDLRRKLRQHAGHVDATTTWPAASIAACADAGVLRGFVPVDLGGDGWDQATTINTWLELSGACLTTAFVLTQIASATRRIARAADRQMARQVLAGVMTGETVISLGISHLTTSHLHLGRPALAASKGPAGWHLDGFSPWVSGAARSDFIVTGGVTPDGEELLTLVAPSWDGVHVLAPARLLALDGSLTSTVRYDHVTVPTSHVLQGPTHGVAATVHGKGTGGVHTTALALGLAREAASFLVSEARARRELADIGAALAAEIEAAIKELLRVAAGGPPRGAAGSLRSEANSLVERSTTAALVAAKGAGFVSGHPIGRWCREALFFRVWSTPDAVRALDLARLGAGRV